MKQFLCAVMTGSLLFHNALSGLALDTNEILHYTENTNKDVTMIVEVEGDPTLLTSKIYNTYSLTNAESEVLNAQARVMSEIKDEVSDDIEKGFVYTSLFNGFSIEANLNQLEEIKALPGVKNVYVSEARYISDPTSSESGALADISYSYNLGFNGEGQVIAVLDVGCDTSHEFFSTAPQNPKYTKEEIDTILKNSTLNSGTSSANQVYKSAKIPYAYNYATNSADTYIASQSHGTHVSGIAVGKNGKLPDGNLFSGIAPEAQLIFMSCATESGAFYDHMVFAALNDAALLEVDVINMSFGADYYDSAIDTAYCDIIKNASDAGISIFTSAGNSTRGYLDKTPLAKNPDYSASGSPSGFSSLTAVASADNSKRYVSYWAMTLPDETEIALNSPYSGSEFDSILTEGEYTEYVDCKLGKQDEIAELDLTGKIALIKRGEIPFTEKSDNVKNKGAVGIIFINTTNDILDSIVSVSLPAASVPLDLGTKLIDSSDKRLKYIGKKAYFAEVSTAGKISSYSSWGVDSSLELKPEITAPGGKIYSSIPDNKYASKNGTSMSSPFMAGIAAITRQYYKTAPFIDEYNNLENANKSALIENLAMNSAEIIMQESNVPYSPRVQGAGLVNIENILNARVLLTGNSGKAKLSLGEISGENLDLSFKITNISKEAITFDKISVSVLTDGYEDISGEYYVSDTVSLDVVSDNLPETITVNSGEEYTLSATVQLDSNKLSENAKIFENGFFIDGFVILDTTDGSDRASLPFTGFYGDWDSLPIFDSTIYDAGGSTLSDEDVPFGGGTALIYFINDNSYCLAGVNPFNQNILDKKYISYSPQRGFPLGFSAQNYRAVKKLVFTILDSDEQIVKAFVSNDAYPKFYSGTWKLPADAFSSLSDGAYTMQIDATALNGEGINDTLTLPLFIDNTAPEILSADLNEETNTLTISAKDNHYLSTFYIVHTLVDGSQKLQLEDLASSVYIKDGIVHKTIDLNGINTDGLIIGCSDYCLNKTAESLTTFTDKVAVSLESLTRADSITSATIKVRNNTENTVKTKLLLAFYAEDERLMTASLKDCSIAPDKESTVNYALLSDTQDAKFMKVFILGTDFITPLDTAKTFTLTEN